MKRKFKVWTAAFMAAAILEAGSITVSAATSVTSSVTPPADSAGYIVAGEVLDFPETEYALRWTFTYDAGGRLAKISDADCVYDELGNLVNEVRSDGSRIEYVYG